MSKREVTELDFRKPEFRLAKVEDYEIRDDGAIVRKDRWEVGLRNIASALGFSARDSWEITDVVARADELVSGNGLDDDLKCLMPLYGVTTVSALVRILRDRVDELERETEIPET